MDALVHAHQQINPFPYQKSPQDFHTYLNVPQENCIPSCTGESWSSPGKNSFSILLTPSITRGFQQLVWEAFPRQLPGPDVAVPLGREAL